MQNANISNKDKEHTLHVLLSSVWCVATCNWKCKPFKTSVKK